MGVYSDYDRQKLHLKPAKKQASRQELPQATQNSEITVEPFFELASDLLAIVDLSGYFYRVNSAFSQTLGYSKVELTRQPILSFIHPEDLLLAQEKIGLLRQGMASIKLVSRYCCRNGSYRRLQWSITLASSNPNFAYGVAKDVTFAPQVRPQLPWPLDRDRITGLPNRCQLERKIAEIIRTKELATFRCTFCYLDLDRFRVINELCGHTIGDRLLKQVTRLLQVKVRGVDVLFHLGGDKFGLLLRGHSLAESEIVAHQIRLAIKEHIFRWQNKTYRLSVSIGLVEMNQHTGDFSSLLNAAEVTCGAAKQQGRNWIRVYSPQDRELVRQRREQDWLVKLDFALENDLFQLYCQKIAPLQPGQGSNHYEILLRLFDEHGSLVSPMEFIPIAERHGLMPQIDRWVIQTFLASYEAYCRDIQQQQQHQQTDNPHSENQPLDNQQPDRTVYTINLSGASINSDRFLPFLKQQFIIHKVRPEQICFEITETVMINNLNKAAQFVREIKNLGCSFALDDFGSGASSFSYLKKLPVDYLKIDGNFVKNMTDSVFDRTMVEFFDRLSKMKNIQTIAEFVENEAIITQLREIGVNYAQGYGIEKPIPLCFPTVCDNQEKLLP